MHLGGGRRRRASARLLRPHRRRPAARRRARARSLHGRVGEGHPPGAGGRSPAAVAADDTALGPRVAGPGRHGPGAGRPRLRRRAGGGAGDDRVPPPPRGAGGRAPARAASPGDRARGGPPGGGARGCRRPHQRRCGLPVRRRPRRRRGPRHAPVRRPPLPPQRAGLDGHRLPGAVDPDRPLAGGGGPAARARPDRRGAGAVRRRGQPGGAGGAASRAPGARPGHRGGWADPPDRGGGRPGRADPDGRGSGLPQRGRGPVSRRCRAPGRPRAGRRARAHRQAPARAGRPCAPPRWPNGVRPRAPPARP